MAQPEFDPELVADVEEAFLGYWPKDLAAIFTRPYKPGAITAYAHREGGKYLPQDGGE
jgi:hypothetical protein